MADVTLPPRQPTAAAAAAADDDDDDGACSSTPDKQGASSITIGDGQIPNHIWY